VRRKRTSPDPWRIWIRFKRQLWERQDRTPDKVEDQEAIDNETLLEGEREKEEIYESMQDGTPTLAPDELTPEKSE